MLLEWLMSGVQQEFGRMSMSEPQKKSEPQKNDDLSPADALKAQQALEQAKLQHRRQILKAAAIAAPMLVTLHAKSAYANGSSLGSTGINYGGPGTYSTDPAPGAPIPITEPGKKKKKGRWG